LVGPPSLHAALLRGGSELSTYASSCTLGIERRTIPGETELQVASEVRAILERLAAAGAETLLVGPTGAGAHAAEEWVDLESLEALAGILVDVAISYCN
jgi:acetylornithine deacetylase/succinyl-diaminopimelate desuccinylase-like protein